jgi:tRNA 2-thiocytidine biosynthesis protein TtcA
VRVGEMLRAWEREDPGRIERIFDAMARVVPSHLMDRNLFAFAGLQPTGVADADGDRAFDDEAPAPPIVAMPDRQPAASPFAIDTSSRRPGEPA